LATALAISVLAALPVPAEDQSISSGPMPKCTAHPYGDDFYPVPALARNVQGRVYVAFAIDDSGKAKKAKILAAEPDKTFVQLSLHLLSELRCDVPKDRSTLDVPERMFRASFIFEFEPGGAMQQFAPNDFEMAIRAKRIGTPR
jgi:outer membrane biosynthesis protein TonB